MSISQSQIVDLLFKQEYGVTKTDNATNKSPSNESISSPLLIRADTMWVQSGSIPNIATGIADLIQSYTDINAVQCVADTTTVSIGGVYPTWKTNLSYWIPQQFGATYAVKVYVDSPGVANPTITGTQIFAAGSGGIGEFFFNYQSGVLNFIGETIPPSLTSSKVIYIVGYRYVGLLGANNQASLTVSGPVNLGSVANVNISGGSNGQYLQTNGSGNLSWASITSYTLPPATNTTLGGVIAGTTLTVDEFGLLNVTSGRYVETDGGTISGNLIMTSNSTVTGIPTPVNATDAASKSYVDNLITGLSWKQAVVTVSSTDVVVSSPVSDIIGGATLTAGDRVLLIGQVDTIENGIWIYNGTGTPMVRSSDASTPTQLNGAAVFVQSGTSADVAYTQTTTLSGSFSGQVWVQFGAGATYSAGNGLTLDTGNIFNVAAANGLTFTGSQQLTLNLEPDKALAFNGQQLTLNLAIDGGLSQSANGLTIAAGGVSNAMLANSGFTFSDDSGNTGSASLGKSIAIGGDTAQGIKTTLNVSNTGVSYSITANNATTSSKGVASFSNSNFAVANGEVSVKTGGITNDNLVNSSITVTANTGSQLLALGNTINIVGTNSISTTSSGSNVIITVEKATTNTAGIASFNSDNFTVFDGIVSLTGSSVSQGGTGRTSLTQNRILWGNGTNPVGLSDNLTFDANTNIFTVGGDHPIVINGNTGSISAGQTNDDLLLVPNGTGAIVLGGIGDTVLETDGGGSLTVRAANSQIILESQIGDTVMKLPAGTEYKVSISGPSAQQYASGLASNDLVNRQYIDNALIVLNGGTFG